MREKQSSSSSSIKAAAGASTDSGGSHKGTSTELRLCPPGSDSPPPPGAGSKRGFGGGVKTLNGSGSGSGGDDVAATGSSRAMDKNHTSSAAPALHASKEQVVGWPPIRSFRKNSMVAKNNDKAGHKLESAGCLYVKVSMDGAPYLRKVDLNTYGSYAQLSAALEKMFSCFTIGMTLLGQYGYNGVPGRDGLSLSGSRLKDIHPSSEQCVLTYEDKDGDWMLVGDVPWDMFTNTCRRIRITKSTEAIGLAPRAVGKYKNDVHLSIRV